MNRRNDFQSPEQNLMESPATIGGAFSYIDDGVQNVSQGTNAPLHFSFQ